MADIVAYRSRRQWVVPVGSVINDELRDCDHCGHGVNVLTIRTADGPVVVEDDQREHADEDTTVCMNCRDY